MADSLDDAELRVVDRAEGVVLPVLDRLRSQLRPGSQRGVQLKGDGTLVTAADAAADRELTSAILDAFPDHGVLSEEQATTAPGTDWTWVLDPVDGTANMTAGLPYWCVAVALCLEGRPVWAAVDAPALAVRYLTRAGGGARRLADPHGPGPPSDRVLRVAGPVRRAAASSTHVPLLVTAGVLRGAPSRSGLNPRVLGSVALDLCGVAAGHAAAAIHPSPHVWDIAAGGLVLEEAGGILLELGDGQPLLPLRPGVDYAGRTVPIAAGPREAWLRELAATVGVGGPHA